MKPVNSSRDDIYKKSRMYANDCHDKLEGFSWSSLKTFHDQQSLFPNLKGAHAFLTYFHCPPPPDTCCLDYEAPKKPSHPDPFHILMAISLSNFSSLILSLLHILVVAFVCWNLSNSSATKIWLFLLKAVPQPHSQIKTIHQRPLRIHLTDIQIFAMDEAERRHDSYGHIPVFS